MHAPDDLLQPFEPGENLVYVRWFRTKTGRVIHASAYGKKCFVFRKKAKKSDK